MEGHTLDQTTVTTEAQNAQTSGYALGLDVGSNSIGWMLVREIPRGDGKDVVGGVRIFPAATATEKNTEKSKTADRRAARGMRRQHDRRSRRRRRLTYVLREIGLLPPKPEPIDFVYALDPWECRARGLDERLEKHELARALIHLAQRRGFKSNRQAKAGDKAQLNESKKTEAQIQALRDKLQDTNCRTVGEYLYKHVPLIRDRRRGRYLHRTMIIDEFEQLWEAQKQFYPDLLTDDAREKVFDTIFYQRPFLKRERLAQLVGQCQFEPSEKRARIGHRLVQKYRIYQETANLRLIAPDGAERTLTLAELKELRDYLETNKELEFEAEQNKISRAHKLLNLDPNIVINFAAAKRKALKGNVVEVEFRKALGEVWVNLTEEKKDALNELVLEEDDEDRLIQRAKEEFGLDDEAAKKLTEIVLPSNFGRVSLAAIRKLLPLMEEGHDLSEALKAAGYDKREPELRLDYLPFPPGTRFGKREEKLVQEGLVLPHTTEVTNPVVRKALFEVRKLVNAIIRKYGKPDRIVVELARDTRGSIEDRREIQREQRQRERENEMIKKELISGGLTDPSKTDIVKYRLWLECNKTCPYSGRPISFEQLFLSGEVDIEHIIPYGRSLDDSFANKTLCFRDWNQKKGDRTPWEAFGESDPEAYEKMLQRVRAFQGDFRPKLRRFIQREVNLDACIDRQLNDTRYIARVVRNYLSVLGIPVGVARGQVTATLRRCWGLNTILSPDGSDEKNRSDHRHHAVDAAVIAMTTAKHLKNLAHREDFRREKQAFPQPWDGFRKAVDEAVKAIIVSHAPTRRVRGPLHEETNYGPTQEEDEFVYRKPLADLTINEVKDKIRDKRIRDLVMKRLDEKWPGWRDKAGTERIPAGVFPESDPLLLPNRNGGDPIPVRKVRLVTRLGNAIGLPHGNPSRFVKPGENHHLEIFEYEERGKLKWDAVPVTLFEAARRLRQHEPVVSRVHPEKPDARFVMSLCKNDMVKYRKNSGRIFRVRKFSKVQAFELVLDPHWLAVADGRKEEQVKITSLKELADVEKVNVTVLGEVTAAND